MAQYDDLNTRQIWIVGIVSAVLTGVTILAVQVLYYSFQSSHEAGRAGSADYSPSVSYISAQSAQLERYGRDPETGNIQIPIDKAFDLLLQKNAAKRAAQPAAEANTGKDEA